MIQPHRFDASEIGSQVAHVFDELSASNPDLARALGLLTLAVVTEATRSRRFDRALTSALCQTGSDTTSTTEKQSARASRRQPGPWDPFEVYAEFGQEELRKRLSELDVERLRDMIAEHGMDNDRLAMKWKSTDRLVSRIIDRVATRAAKGDAFR